MKVAIIGYGVEGQSALHYWQDQGAAVTVCDQNDRIELPAGVASQLGAQYLKGLNHFDLIVRSAGIHPSVILRDNPGVKSKITTVINEFLRVCPTTNVIGITGTKGKGTTTTLVAKMLEAAGKQVFVGGNIGISPLVYLDQITPESWVVLELSSFQLFDVQYSPHIAVCLMMAGEHFNWHGDLDSYVKAKSQLFAHQTPDDVAIYFADSRLSHQIASASPGDKIAYYDEPGAYVMHGNIMIDQQVLCKTKELKLLGKHNWQNACAAATVVWQVIQAPDAIRQVLITFAGLPHRLEFVRTVDGVAFYNDSFASAPPSPAAALEAIAGKKIMILGGFDRMLPLEQLALAVKKYEKELRAVLLVGASAERLAAELKAADFTNFHLVRAQSMPAIVAAARRHAKKGDNIVLSPGFPSFDMFKNFEERGLLFKQAVHNL